MSSLVKNAYDNGECPDCAEPIADDAVPGSECSNCGHAFYAIEQCPECGHCEPSDGYGGNECPNCETIMEVVE